MYKLRWFIHYLGWRLGIALRWHWLAYETELYMRLAGQDNSAPIEQYSMGIFQAITSLFQSWDD